MDAKKKKSKQDLINSAMGELTKGNDPSGINGPLIPVGGKAATGIRALISPDGDSSNYHGTKVMPDGLERTAVFKQPASKIPESQNSNILDSSKNVSGSEFNQDNEATNFFNNTSPKIPDQIPNDNTDLIARTGTFSVDRTNYGTSSTQDENTVIVGKGARAKIPEMPAEDKTSFGMARPSTRTLGSPTASASDAQVNKAENLRIAQERLTDLERELERLRSENEQLASANAAAKDQLFEVSQKVMRLEQEINNNMRHYQSEVGIFRDSASLKEVELIKSRSKIEELSGRLNMDLRKIRVRERELENRLELTRMEKEALLRAKDDAILDLKRKLSNTTHEIDGYRQKINDLSAKIENNNDQFSRTVRALRLALSNLEANGDTAPAPIPLKKAE